MKRLLTVVLALCMIFALCACGQSAAPAAPAAPAESGFTPAADSVLNTGVFRVAMECAYAPYNWTQSDDSNGAVPIYGAKDFANGYDVMMAKKIADANGWTLEIHKMDWDSIPLAVQSGAVDAGICGQSITPERLETMDFSDPYYFASIVTLTKADSSFAAATGLSGLAGATCTSQINTIWYDSCLPQIENANILAAQETAPAMLVSLEAGAVDIVVTDEPTALAACVAYPDFVLLNFTGTDDDFAVDEGDINIGISIMKGNSELVSRCNEVLATMDASVYTEIMNSAIEIQPLSE